LAEGAGWTGVERLASDSRESNTETDGFDDQHLWADTCVGYVARINETPDAIHCARCDYEAASLHRESDRRLPDSFRDGQCSQVASAACPLLRGGLGAVPSVARRPHRKILRAVSEYETEAQGHEAAHPPADGEPGEGCLLLVQMGGQQHSALGRAALLHLWDARSQDSTTEGLRARIEADATHKIMERPGMDSEIGCFATAYGAGAVSDLELRCAPLRRGVIAPLKAP